jgi:hypothetical protein
MWYNIQNIYIVIQYIICLTALIVCVSDGTTDVVDVAYVNM